MGESESGEMEGEREREGGGEMEGERKRKKDRHIESHLQAQCTYVTRGSHSAAPINTYKLNKRTKLTLGSPIGVI